MSKELANYDPEEQKQEVEKEKRPPEKVGLGHARKHQKRMESVKKLWKGGGC